MGKILLEGMEFFAFHGCFKEERIIGSKFIVDLSVDFDSIVAEDSDSLMDTIDYAKLYGSIKKQMAEKSHLLEHLAKRIILAVQTEFPAISVIELKIAKINPPLGGKIQQVSFRTSWKK